MFFDNESFMLSKHLYVIITKLLYLQAQILFPAPDNLRGKIAEVIDINNSINV